MKVLIAVGSVLMVLGVSLVGFTAGGWVWTRVVSAPVTVGLKAVNAVLADGGRTDGGPADGGPADVPLRRLRVGEFTTEDGFRVHAPTYYDTLLKTPCQPSADAKGVMRCFPSGPYKTPTYRGVDAKTGECLEEVVVAPVNPKTENGLVGINRGGAGSLHRIGQRLTGLSHWVKVAPLSPDEKQKCLPQTAPLGSGLYALGEDLTGTLAVLKFSWVDAPPAVAP